MTGLERTVLRAVIYNQEGKLLFGKRARGVEGGKLAFIGGKPDSDETEERAVIREVREEIGASFAPIFWFEMIDTESVPGETWRVCFFYGLVSGPITLKEDEISEVVLVSEEELPRYDIAFNHFEIATRFFREVLPLL